MECYLCHQQISTFIHKNGYTIYRCLSCGLAQTELGEDYDKFLERNYRQGYFTGDPRFSAYVNYRDDKPLIVRNMRKFITHLKKYKVGGKLLDVGCAMGFFIELALRAGFDAYGFDASNFAVSYAQKVNGGHRVKWGTVQTVSYPPKSFDVITLFDVFEHLAEPLGDIKKLSKYLKDDGLFVIATGDTQSLAARILKRRWTFYIPPQHLFFFNRKTLTTLLREAGLEPVVWFRVGKWLSLRYVLHLGRTTGESKLAGWLYDLVKVLKLGKLPLYLPMRDNMVVIAKKIHEKTPV